MWTEKVDRMDSGDNTNKEIFCPHLDHMPFHSLFSGTTSFFPLILTEHRAY